MALFPLKTAHGPSRSNIRPNALKAAKREPAQRVGTNDSEPLARDYLSNEKYAD